MVTFTERLLICANTGEFRVLQSIVGGYLGGYVYGKLAGLPASQVAQAWVICAVASTIFFNIIPDLLTENKRVKNLIRAVIITATCTIFWREMRQRGLLGDKMMGLQVGLSAMATIRYFALFALNIEPRT